MSTSLIGLNFLLVDTALGYIYGMPLTSISFVPKRNLEYTLATITLIPSDFFFHLASSFSETRTLTFLLVQLSVA